MNQFTKFGGFHTVWAESSRSPNSVCATLFPNWDCYTEQISAYKQVGKVKSN